MPLRHPLNRLKSPTSGLATYRLHQLLKEAGGVPTLYPTPHHLINVGTKAPKKSGVLAVPGTPGLGGSLAAAAEAGDVAEDWLLLAFDVPGGCQGGLLGRCDGYLVLVELQ